MISFLEGSVIRVAPTSLVVSVQGVGFTVAVTPTTAAATRVGESVALNTKLVVKEDDLALYGFESDSDLAAFELLTTVSGVGPKSAMAVLSTLGADGLAHAVDAADETAFKPVPGIGPKTARLIIVQLSGKVVATSATPQHSPSNDMVEALVGLGWQEAKASQTVATLIEQNPALAHDSSALLRAALQSLGGRR